jgi:hypothetical protein
MCFKALTNAEKLMELHNYGGITPKELPHVQRYQQALETGNQEVIDEFESFGDSFRHIIRNITEYELGREAFGFVEKSFDQHGWLIRPQFLDIEKLEFDPSSKNARPHVLKNSVEIGRGPNGNWTYGITASTPISGRGDSMNVWGLVYASRKECLAAAIQNLIGWHEQAEHKTSAGIIAEARKALNAHLLKESLAEKHAQGKKSVSFFGCLAR